jgi:hypothetical protein
MTKTRKNNPTRTSNKHSAEPGSTIIAAGHRQVAPAEPAAKPPSKQQQLASLLVRDEGASLDQMIVVTGWQPHTTRAALTGLKKKGYALSSDKIEGVRTYRAVAPE